MKFKNLEFAYREFNPPLFWITKNRYCEGDYLIIHEKNVAECYFADKGLQETIENGYKLFSNGSRVDELRKESEKLLVKIDKEAKRAKGIHVSELTDQKLRGEFVRYLNLLQEIAGVYLWTEPARFQKLEEEVREFLKTKRDLSSDLFLQLLVLEGEGYKKTLHNLKAPKRIINFVSIIREFSVVRFRLRKATEPIWRVILGVLLKEMARRFKVRAISLRYFTYQEIFDLLKGKKEISGRVIKQRREKFGFGQVGGERRLLTQGELNEASRVIKRMEEEQRKRVLTGQVAMKGRVIGRVRRIAHEQKDLSRKMRQFKEGEILVTEMTRPQLTAICHKAAAIVTDEGGITCHAAIVSRELGIPCIIGTKIATKVLADGDLVEVNAEEGIVKVIEKAR